MALTRRHTDQHDFIAVALIATWALLLLAAGVSGTVAAAILVVSLAATRIGFTPLVPWMLAIAVASVDRSWPLQALLIATWVTTLIGTARSRPRMHQIALAAPAAALAAGTGWVIAKVIMGLDLGGTPDRTPADSVGSGTPSTVTAPTVPLTLVVAGCLALVVGSVALWHRARVRRSPDRVLVAKMEKVGRLLGLPRRAGETPREFSERLRIERGAPTTAMGSSMTSFLYGPPDPSNATITTAWSDVKVAIGWARPHRRALRWATALARRYRR